MQPADSFVCVRCNARAPREGIVFSETGDLLCLSCHASMPAPTARRRRLPLGCSIGLAFVTIIVVLATAFVVQCGRELNDGLHQLAPGSGGHR